jgi:hypothetical protein
MSLLPAACGAGDSGEAPAAAPGAEGGDPATDKLAQVVARGTLTLSTDAHWQPLRSPFIRHSPHLPPL